MTDLNFVRDKKKRFFVPLKVGSNLKCRLIHYLPHHANK